MKAICLIKILGTGLVIIAVAGSSVLSADIDSQTQFDRQRYIDVDQIEDSRAALARPTAG